MSIPDDLLEEWYRLAIPIEASELEAALHQVRDDPYRAKRALGRRIVSLFHDAAAADAAEAHFNRLFKEHSAPEEMPEMEIALSDDRLRFEADAGVRLIGLVVAAGLAATNGEAARLIEQGAISIDEQRVTDRQANVPVAAGQTVTLRRGKRNFARVRFLAT
jgi:tyrosyl-tRNA synthetase